MPASYRSALRPSSPCQDSPCQDRLVKALRLAGISSIEAANERLQGYLPKHNAQNGHIERLAAREIHRE